MKRHPTLLQLSREHHGALKLAVQAKRAADSGDAAQIEAATADCIAAFATELAPHFAIEEESLLPQLLAAGETELAQRLQHEHTELRTLVTDLQSEAHSTTLHRFGDRLMAHVRFEERQMFVVLENLWLKRSTQA